MPVVVLPPEFATAEIEAVGYTTEVLLAKPGRATLLARILEACDVPSSQASQWCLVGTTREDVLDDAALRSLSAHARVHLSRVGAARPPQYVELRDGAGAASASAAGREVQNYVSAEPRHDFMDFLGINASVFDALLEWLDNAVKSLHPLPPGAPREVYFGFHFDSNANTLHLFVRDSGAGMARERLTVWPSLGNAANAAPEPESYGTPEGDPRAPYAPGLGQWRVGAKTGLAVLTGDAGRTEVYTRAAGHPKGLGGDVAYLIFDKSVAKARDEAARAAGGRAEPGKNWFDLEAGVRAPTIVQRGVVDDPRGGRWRASGTLVEVAGCSDAVAQVFRAEREFYVAAMAASGAAPPEDDDDAILEIDGEAAGPSARTVTGALPSSPLLKAVCMVYHNYIHKLRLDSFAPVPPPGEAPKQPGAAESDSESDEEAEPVAPRGKDKGPAKGASKTPVGKSGRPSKLASAVHSREHLPLLSLHYCLITPELSIVRTCANVSDDLVSRMLHAGSCASPSAATSSRAWLRWRT